MAGVPGGARNVEVTAAGGNDRFGLVWEYAGSDPVAGPSLGAMTLSFDPTTLSAATGANVTIDDAGAQVNPSIAMDLAGDFTVVWDGNGSTKIRPIRTIPR